jgi:hypothetical protein
MVIDPHYMWDIDIEPKILKEMKEIVGSNPHVFFQV